MEIKRKHHYVWREYLRSWCHSKDMIHTYIKSNDKLFSSNLINVAQQKYFYSLEDFTTEEEKDLETFVRNFSNKNMLKANLALYELFISYSKIKRTFIKTEINNKQKVDEFLLALKANTLEDFHSLIENLGSKIINTTSFEDLSFLNNKEDEYNTMLFFCIQYLRTNKNKKSVEKKIQYFKKVIPKYLNLISILFAQMLASQLLINKKVKYIYYENQTDLDFITSDQPLVNILKDLKDENGLPTDFELYYPISPRIAILIHYKEQKNKYEYSKINANKVNELNEFIFKNAEEFIFSISEKQLDDYKNCL